MVDLRSRSGQQLKRRDHRVSRLLVDLSRVAEGRRPRLPEEVLNQVDRRWRHRTNLPRPLLESVTSGGQQDSPSDSLPLRLVTVLIALHSETVHHQQKVVNILLKRGPLIIRLIDATPANAGAKAAVLGQLTRAGFAVPPAFVIPIAAYRAATAHLDLPRALTSRNPDEARQLVEAQPVPPSVVDELAEALAALGNHPVAVRSSATGEDTPTASAAGQHDTYLGVDGLDAIVAKVQAIWGSLWTPRAIAYRQTTPSPAFTSPTTTSFATASAATAAASSLADPGIAILIQRHIDADVAGVLFTADPRTSNTAVLEASWGLGESVVQGLVTPDTYTLTPSGTLTHRLGPKQTRRDRTRTTSGLTTTEVPPHQQQQLCLTPAQAHQIMHIGQTIATHLAAPQDIEFALQNNHLYLLQSRPITTPLDPTPQQPAARKPITRPPVARPPVTPLTTAPHHPASSTQLQPDMLATPQADAPDLQSSTPIQHPGVPATGEPGVLAEGEARVPAVGEASVSAEGESLVLRGVGGSAGVASGPVRVVRGVEDFGRVKPGDILVCRFTDPAWTPLFSLVAGVITEVGGRLSHAAIVAREHRIPAVLGVPKATTTLPDNHSTQIDGSTGLITPTPTAGEQPREPGAEP